MAINYTKIGWDTSKYVNPTNMNQMDNGIKAACDAIDSDVLLKSGGTISGNLVVNGSYTLLDNMIGKKLIVLNRTDDNAGIILGNQSATGYYGYVGMAKNGYMATLTPDTLTASRTHKLPDASGTIALAEDFTPTGYQYIGASGHETTVQIARVGKICFLVFNGAYWGFTIPSGFLPVTNAPQRNILIGGTGSERWMAHIEGTSPYSVYLHKNGGETVIPTDGTYNVYGTATYICQ